MKGDFSRDTFDPVKRYSGVLMQQGRVQLDADWNEQLSIQLHRTHAEAIDTIGLAGAPRENGGFKIEALPGSIDLSISHGRIYVGGLMCELEPTPVALTVEQPNRVRVSHVNPDGRAFETGEWVELSAANKTDRQVRRISTINAADSSLTLDANLTGFGDALNPLLRRTSIYTAQPDNPAPTHTTAADDDTGARQLALDDGLYIAYLHAWEQHQTALDDPHLREKALGGPDTTTRIKNVWQVNLLRVGGSGGAADCQSTFPEWDALTAPVTGMMNARVQPVEASTDPCTLPPSAGYRRLENQLYRVEVHKGGGRDAATFKWSRENGSVQTAIQEINAEKIVVADPGKDEVLGFKGGDWVEVVSGEDELGLPSTPLRPLLRIVGQPDAARREVTLSSSVGDLQGQTHLKLRRWEQTGDNLSNAVEMTAGDGADAEGWVDLEGGIQIRFSEGTYQPGDYWLIPARTADAGIEWPPFAPPDADPVAQPPRGIRHHYSRLALLRVAGETITVEDCRDIFPPLTAITAVDVSFDNTHCLPDLADVETVQEAIEALCHNRENSCTFVAVPGPGWEQVFARIADGQDAQVCFQVGHYPLERAVVVRNKGHLKLSGCGPGTRIVAPDAEAALSFVNCKTVTVRDLYAETGRVGGGEEAATTQLNGTLGFYDCESATVESVAIRCGAGAEQAASCITVRNARGPGPRPARILHCDLQIGHQQQGILLVNAPRAHVDDNFLRVYDKPDRLRLPNLLVNDRLRAGLRRVLISGAHFGETAPTDRTTNVRLSLGDQVVHFKTHSFLRREWARLLRANPPARRITTSRSLLAHLRGLADRILLDADFRNRLPRFRTIFEALVAADRAVAAQGITVGGTIAEDIRISNNTIEGVLQGIHIGLSDESPRPPGRRTNESAEVVTVAHNTIALVLPPDAGKSERHGIFVGNCRSLFVDNNYAQLQRLEQADEVTIEGVRIWGVLGRRIMVARNHLSNFNGEERHRFDVGIRIQLEAPIPAGSVGWFAIENVVACHDRLPVRAPARTIQRENIRVD
jgi:hypothetical protein